jgi:hypothetical protein
MLLPANNTYIVAPEPGHCQLKLSVNDFIYGHFTFVQGTGQGPLYAY